MKRPEMTIDHEFVTSLPEQMDPGKLYISIPFATAGHKCCCGCEEEVITPISPAKWKLTFDGETVSLSPSIGNWNQPCQSHYWIIRNRVRWSRCWSVDEIREGRHRSEQRRSAHLHGGETDKTAG